VRLFRQLRSSDLPIRGKPNVLLM